MATDTNGDDSVKALKAEVTEMNLAMSRLSERITRLEEARATTKAEMELVAARAVADVRVMRAEIASELRVQNALLVAEFQRKVLEGSVPTQN